MTVIGTRGWQDSQFLTSHLNQHLRHSNMPSSRTKWRNGTDAFLDPWQSLSSVVGGPARADMVNSVPLEIIDHIMDHLWDDKKSLLACSLVRRQWMFSATYHLFRRITVTDDVACRHFYHFAVFLRSDSVRRIGRCIRELHLQSHPPGRITTKLVDLNLQLLTGKIGRAHV